MLGRERGLRLVLASRSASRRAILKGAGLQFVTEPADLDETSLLRDLAGEGETIERQAEILSVEKARAVAGQLGEQKVFVIGSDQILNLDGKAMEAPQTRDDAHARLRVLRGRRHDLVCGVAVFYGNRLIESHTERVAVFMRDYSDVELSSYMERAPTSAYGAVGAYELEGLGAQLVDRIEGDWFSALGLPLWPVLRILRAAIDQEEP